MSHDYSISGASALLAASSKKLAAYSGDARLACAAADDPLAVLNMVEELALGIRAVYEHPAEYGEPIPKPDMKQYEEALKKAGVIGRSPEGFFRMVVPPLINRRNKRFGTSYDSFYGLLRPEIREGTLPPVEGPQVFVYKRYTRNLFSQLCMDNENVDAQNLTNAVCAAFRISDGPAAASFYYGAVASVFEVTELTLVPLSEMGCLSAILAPDTPKIYTPEGHEIPLSP